MPGDNGASFEITLPDGAYAGRRFRVTTAEILPAITTAEKARRVDHALRTERDTLRSPPAQPKTQPAHRDECLRVANVIVAFLNDADDDTKARLFDLIVGNETKDAALQSLEDTGFRPARPGEAGYMRLPEGGD